MVPPFIFCSTFIISSVLLANYITYFGRNILVSADTAVFRPKDLHFGRNKNISAEYSVSAEFRFFRMACFGFRCFGKKSVSVGHYYEEYEHKPMYKHKTMKSTKMYEPTYRHKGSVKRSVREGQACLPCLDITGFCLTCCNESRRRCLPCNELSDDRECLFGICRCRRCCGS